MFNDDFYMWWRITWVASILLGCTTPNPRSCSDGLCTDPAFPFCDIAGEVAGSPQTCIAVSCAPTEFEACRGNQALTCNSAGNDFDVTECPLGCDSLGGCRSCTNDTQCNNPSPICDTGTNSCRACQADDECASKVCNRTIGSCVPEASVVYASPAGSGQCSLPNPCSLAQAVMVALGSAVTPTLRMLPGTYTLPLDVQRPGTTPLEVVGTGAILAPSTSAIILNGGANVDVRDVVIVSPQALKCGAANATPSTLSIYGASITATGNTTVMDLVRCSLHLSTSEIDLSSSEIAVLASDDVSLKIDRVRIHGNTQHHIAAVGKHMTMELTNTLLEDVGLDLNTSDTGAPGSTMTFAADTFVFLNSSLSQGCGSSSPNRVIRYENTIVAAIGAFDSVSGMNCTFVNTLLSRQAVPPPGTSVADPQFLAAGTRDFHLKSTSPAIDAALPSVFGLDSIEDLDGTARPQGPKPDIGAYELKP